MGVLPRAPPYCASRGPLANAVPAIPSWHTWRSLSILTPHGLLLFIGAELIFSLTPGPTVMMISAYGFKGGFRDALAAIAGTQTGNTLWYVICVTGLGALVTASPLLFHAIRLAGRGLSGLAGRQRALEKLSCRSRRSMAPS